MNSIFEDITDRLLLIIIIIICLYNYGYFAN